MKIQTRGVLLWDLAHGALEAKKLQNQESGVGLGPSLQPENWGLPGGVPEPQGPRASNSNVAQQEKVGVPAQGEEELHPSLT